MNIIYPHSLNKTLALQRGSLQLSYARILFIQTNCYHSSNTVNNTPSTTEYIVTNTTTMHCNQQNTEKTMFKNALNNIPTRILYQLLKKNRIKVSSRNTNHRNYKYTPPKKLLLSKLYRLTTKNIQSKKQDQQDKQSEDSNNCKSRLEINNFVNFSSELVRKTCLKFHDLNEFYNMNYHLINSSHLFYQTLQLLINEITTLNMNISEMNTSDINPSIDTFTNNFDDLKRDFLYELLPSIHNNINQSNNSNKKHSEFDMIKLCEIFIKFIQFPRFTMFDHIHYISHLCLINNILDGFLIETHGIHPSRMRYNDDHDEYDTDEYDDDDEHEFEDENINKNENQIEVRDENGNNIPFQIESIKKFKKNKNNYRSQKINEMDENKLNELYMNRLKNIYAMDLNKYGVFGMDINVKTQLKRALLSRGLHPKFITNCNIENENKNNDLITIEHNKGILFYGPPGTGKTLLAKSLKYLLLINDENIHLVNGPEIEDVYIGQTEKNIRNLFENAKKDYKQFGIYSPLHIIIFDEIDSIAKKRDSSSNSKVYDKAVQQLLSCLDGANSLNNVLTIGTTNRYEDIDNALLRPGRFGIHCYISLPDEKQRHDLLINCCGNNNNNIEKYLFNNNECDLKWLINLTDGLSHSDIVSLITQSKINAIERIIQNWFEKNNNNQNDLYQNIQNNFKITSRDIVCALDEIRINQVCRERNNRQLNNHYAYDIAF